MDNFSFSFFGKFVRKPNLYLISFMIINFFGLNYNMKISGSISSDHIEKFADEMMKNKSINFSMIPDYIEKKLYVNVFSIVLNILDSLLDSVSVHIMGHKISIDIEANKDEVPLNEQLRSISEVDLESQIDVAPNELQQSLIDDFNRLHPVTSDGGMSTSSYSDISAEFNNIVIESNNAKSLKYSEFD